MYVGTLLYGKIFFSVPHIPIDEWRLLMTGINLLIIGLMAISLSPLLVKAYWTIKNRKTITSLHLRDTFAFATAIETSICEICKSDNIYEKKVACPHCGAAFHTPHLLEWVELRGQCPVCHRLIPKHP